MFTGAAMTPWARMVRAAVAIREKRMMKRENRKSALELKGCAGAGNGSR
jgi:hypothetical protein